MDGGAWWATVHRVAKSRPRLSDLASLGCAYTTYYGHTICMYIHGIYICYAFPRVLWKNLKELFGQPSICIRRRQWHPLQDSCLENPMDGGAWWAAVHGVAEGRTRLSDFTFTFHFHALEKEMATHSSVLAWRIPGAGESGGLPSMGSHRVGHD